MMGNERRDVAGVRLYHALIKKTVVDKIRTVRAVYVFRTVGQDS